MPTGQAHHAQWYVRRAERTRGPLPEGQVSREIILGRILLSDELSADREHWRSLTTLPQLIPDVVRQSHTEVGWARLMLARLREDERLRDRRASTSHRQPGDRRQGDRRNFSSLDTLAIPPRTDPSVSLDEKESRLVLWLAIGMVSLFALGFYLLR